jgi:RNA polymerase sigma factor (sigma-70 family)
MILIMATSIMTGIGVRLPPALLTAHDEAELAAAIEAGLLAADARRDGRTTGASEQELIMLELIGQHAAQRFVENNLRLVAMVIRKEAVRSRMPESELFQEGCLGLIEAVRRFDHRRGLRFATYALHWIRAYVGAITANRAGELNLPPSRAERLRELRGAEAKLAQQLGREVTAVELAETVGRRTDWVSKLLSLGSNRPMEDVELRGLELPDETTAEEFEAVLRSAIPGRELLSVLDPVHRDVIEVRYGFADGKEHSLKEVADRLGLTVSKVRRIEIRALEELRSVCPQQAQVHL